MNQHELQPWIVCLHAPQSDPFAPANAHSLAMWRLNDNDEPALALFSEQTSAEVYARQLGEQAYQVLQPTRTAMLSIMIECFQGNIMLAVLDPNATTARRIFKLRDVLKAAKGELSANSRPNRD